MASEEAILAKLRSMPPAQAEAFTRRYLIEGYKKSLYRTAKGLLGYHDINWSTHGMIIKALEAPTTRKLVCVPRGCFKSSIAVVAYCIWRIINNPNVRILIDSELYSNSATFLREIKAHLRSERVVSLFGEFYNDQNWNEGETTVKQRTKALKESTITCGGVGTTKVGQHYCTVLGDDYNSPKNTMTHEGRKKVIDHIRYNTSILEPTGTYVFTATRYHEEDATGFILRDLVGISIEEAIKRSQAA